MGLNDPPDQTPYAAHPDQQQGNAAQGYNPYGHGQYPPQPSGAYMPPAAPMYAAQPYGAAYYPYPPQMGVDPNAMPAQYPPGQYGQPVYVDPQLAYAQQPYGGNYQQGQASTVVVTPQTVHYVSPQRADPRANYMYPMMLWIFGCVFFPCLWFGGFYWWNSPDKGARAWGRINVASIGILIIIVIILLIIGGSA